MDESNEAAAASTINAAAQEPVPEYQPPEPDSVTLIRGVLDKEDGVWHRDATVRELNGYDEEYLASQERRNPDMPVIDYMSLILERGVVSIGKFKLSEYSEADRRLLVNRLIFADRDMLYLGILRATYGREKEIRATCGHCGTENDILIDLVDDFPVKQPDFDVHQPIEVTLTKGRTLRMRLPNGEDTLKAQKESKSIADMNTYLVGLCTEWEPGKPEPSDKLDWARNLSVADRRKLVAKLTGIEIGPQLEAVKTHCAECEGELVVRLDWVSLLLY